MTAVYYAALGADFEKLHPNLQWRYGIDSTSGVAQMASGMMDSVYCSPWMTGPIKMYTRKRASMVTTTRRLVPFSQGNYCYRDESDRECLAVLRTFHLSKGDQRLNSLLVDGIEGLVDYFGDGPEFFYRIVPSVTREGALLLETDGMRWVGNLVPNFAMRGLMGLSMRYLEEWDENRDRFRCEASVRNTTIGEIFHYRGWFTAHDIACSVHEIPDEAWPLRLERRER